MFLGWVSPGCIRRVLVPRVGIPGVYKGGFSPEVGIPGVYKGGLSLRTRFTVGL